MTTNWNWTLNSQKYSLYTKYLPTEAQMFVRFALRLAVSELQGHQEPEMSRMTPNWTWTLDSRNYPAYTKYLPKRPKFWSVLLYDQRFSRCHTFYNSPFTPMPHLLLPPPQKVQKKCQKIQYFIQLPMSMHEFLGANLLCTFRQDVALKFFLPYGWSHVHGNEGKNGEK